MVKLANLEKGAGAGKGGLGIDVGGESDRPGHRWRAIGVLGAVWQHVGADARVE